MSHIPDTKALPVTWFLLALLFWRALTPIIVRFKHPVFTSFIIGMFGLSTDLGFGSQNIVAFLPWYVLGVSARYRKNGQIIWQQWVECTPRSYSNSWQQLFLTTLLFVVPLIACIILSMIAPNWWKQNLGYLISHGYSCLYGLPPSATASACTSFFGWGTRALFYIASLPIILGLLRLTPKGNIPIITKSGINSVAIYLFHPIVLFNVVMLVIVSRGLDIITSGKGAIHSNGAPPYSGALPFILLSLLGFFVFFILSLDCWRCCCWLCLRPPVVTGLIKKRDDDDDDDEKNNSLKAAVEDKGALNANVISSGRCSSTSDLLVDQNGSSKNTSINGIHKTLKVNSLNESLL